MNWNNKRRQWAAVVIALAVLLCGCSEIKQDPEAEKTLDENEALQGPYSVVRVVDGDTLIINLAGQEERVRLIGVDTPESVHPDGEKNVAYGKIAADYTASMLEEQQVEIEYDVQERDRYGRILAYVYLEGSMVNKMLLEEGHAKIATFPPNVKYVEDFTALQEEARSLEKGVWAYESLSQVASEQVGVESTYIGNMNTKKFHRESCSSAQEIKEENKITFETSEEAVTAGYDPCKRCNP